MGRPQCEGTLFFGGGDDVTVSPSSLLGLSCLVGLWSCALAVFMAWSRGWRCWVPTGPALAKAMPRGIRLCLLALRALGLHWLGLSPGGGTPCLFRPWCVHGPFGGRHGARRVVDVMALLTGACQAPFL